MHQFSAIEYFDGRIVVDAHGERKFMRVVVVASDLRKGTLIAPNLLEYYKLWEVLDVTSEFGRTIVMVRSVFDRTKPPEMWRHFDSTPITCYVIGLHNCPKCFARFSDFLSGQVVKDHYVWKCFWARLFRKPRPGFFTMICHECKEIVGYYG